MSRAEQPHDTPLAEERERRRLDMLHLIECGREQMKRRTASGDKQELLKVDALAAQAAALINAKGK
jgi:hypothetical protein